MRAEIESLRAENEAFKGEVELRLSELDDYWKREGALKHRAETAERELSRLRARIEAAPIGIMDKRDALGICAPAEEDIPVLYALQGKRVRLLVEDGGK
jgi:chromosome segregation ATPase